MSATRRKHSASATLEPPNLWTTQADSAGELIVFTAKWLIGGKKRADCIDRPRPRQAGHKAGVMQSLQGCNDTCPHTPRDGLVVKSAPRMTGLRP